MHLAAARQADHQQAERHLEQIGRTARDSLSEAQRMVWALRPGPLEGCIAAPGTSAVYWEPV